MEAIWEPAAAGRVCVPMNSVWRSSGEGGLALLGGLVLCLTDLTSATRCSAGPPLSRPTSMHARGQRRRTSLGSRASVRALAAKDRTAGDVGPGGGGDLGERSYVVLHEDPPVAGQGEDRCQGKPLLGGQSRELLV